METLWKRSLCSRHNVGFLKRSPQHRLEPREAHTQSTCFVARRGSQRLTRQQRHPTPLPRTIKEQCQSCRQQSSSLRRRQRSLLQAADFCVFRSLELLPRKWQPRKQQCRKSTRRRHPEAWSKRLRLLMSRTRRLQQQVRHPASRKHTQRLLRMKQEEKLARRR